MTKKDKESNGTSSDLDAAKAARLDLLVSQLSKDFGAGTIMSFTDGTLPGIQFISSGAIALDKALGGGYPRGRIVEIWGAEGSGKTSLALHAIAEAQKLGGICLFIDAEHSLSLQYAQALGVDTGKLLFSQPDSGETALQILETAIRSGAIDVAVVDSVAALLPRAELEGQIGDQFMGLQARLMSQAMRKLAGVTHTSNTLVIFINQTRSKIGGYGNPVTVAGGNALKFYASQRLEVQRTGTTKDGEVAVANTIRVKVGKNKCAPPYREAEFSIVFGKGIDRARDFLSQAQLNGLVEKKGSWYAIDGKNIAQGEDGAIEYLDAHPEALESLKEQLSQQSTP